MRANSVKDIAEYVVEELEINLGIPKYVSQAMHGFWNITDDVVLNFGQHKGKGLWEVDRGYLVWIADQVETFFKTHSVSGHSFKP